MKKCNTIFRYRCCKHLLEDNELSQTYFYLSSTVGENDINEGRPIFKLNGNKFMWEGLFRYFYYYTYNKFLNKNDIFDVQGMNEFINDTYVRRTIHFLADHNITTYIPQINGLVSVFSEICMLYSQLSDSNSDDFNYLNTTHKDNLESFIYWEIHQVECQPDFESNLNIFLLNLANGISPRMDNFLRHMYDRIYIKDASGANSYSTFVLFIEKLLQQIPELVLPKTCLVSFSNRFNNDNMWANYADKYNGVCLEYYTSNNEINMNNGYRKLYKVHYGNIPNFNLFNYLNIYNPLVRRLFGKYFNKTNLFSNKQRLNKYKKKWYNCCLKASLSKTNDWEKENEYRLIYFNLINYDSKQFYKFTNIKSITLGSRISLDNETKIIRILQQKCKKYSITRFPVYRIERSKNGKLVRSILFIINKGLLKAS